MLAGARHRRRARATRRRCRARARAAHWCNERQERAARREVGGWRDRAASRARARARRDSTSATCARDRKLAIARPRRQGQTMRAHEAPAADSGSPGRAGNPRARDGPRRRTAGATRRHGRLRARQACRPALSFSSVSFHHAASAPLARHERQRANLRHSQASSTACKTANSGTLDVADHGSRPRRRPAPRASRRPPRASSPDGRRPRARSQRGRIRPHATTRCSAPALTRRGLRRLSSATRRQQQCFAARASGIAAKQRQRRFAVRAERDEAEPSRSAVAFRRTISRASTTEVRRRHAPNALACDRLILARLRPA